MGGNKENIGRFEAMQTAENALTGHRDLINIRAQQLGSPVGAIDKVEAFSARQSMVRDEALAVRGKIENQLSMVEQQKLLKAIVAKQRSLGVETKSLSQQAEIQQPQVELQQLAQEIPTAIAMGPTALLIAWILKKLPDRVYKITAAMTILSMAFSACSAMNNREIEIGQVGSAAATASLPNTESNNNAGVEVTPSATATETVAVDPVDALYDQYFAGEKIDVSKLSEDEWVELSIKLAEKKNADRGVNPIIYNNEAYINPDNYMMMNYDGHPDMNETIEMFLPIAGKDENGNLQFENKGEIITIPGSANIDWNMQISEPGDPRLNWPTTEKNKDDGLTNIEYALVSIKKMGGALILIPMILWDKNPGQIYIGGANAVMQSTFRFLSIETDQSNQPLLARIVLVYGGLSFNLAKEGSDFQARSTIREFDELSPFQNHLEEKRIYYVGGNINQESQYKKNNMSRDGYKGIIKLNDTYPVLTDNVKNDKDMLVLAASWLVQKSLP